MNNFTEQLKIGVDINVKFGGVDIIVGYIVKKGDDYISLMQMDNKEFILSLDSILKIEKDPYNNNTYNLDVEPTKEVEYLTKKEKYDVAKNFANKISDEKKRLKLILYISRNENTNCDIDSSIDLRNNKENYCGYDFFNTNNNFINKYKNLIRNNFSSNDFESKAHSYLIKADEAYKNDNLFLYSLYISYSMYYSGYQLLRNHNYDSSICYFITAINLLNQSDNKTIEQNLLNCYLSAVYCSNGEANFKGCENIDDEKFEIWNYKDLTDQILNKKKKNVYQYIGLLLYVNKKYRNDFFERLKMTKNDKIIIDSFTVSSEFNIGSDKENSLIDHFKNIYKKYFDEIVLWINKVISNVNFDLDIDDFENYINNFKLSPFVTESDKEILNSYFSYFHKIEESNTFLDFDDRTNALNDALIELKNLKNNIKNNYTFFCLNYMTDVVDGTISNLEKYIKTNSEKNDAKLTLSLPIKTFHVNKDGCIAIPITISNKKNKATAKRIGISIFDENSNELYTNSKFIEAIKGGTSISRLFKIPIRKKRISKLSFRIIFRSNSADISDHSCDCVMSNQFDVKIESDSFKSLKNPYIYGTPVDDDKMFFGRDDLIANLTNDILDNTVKCIIIYGQKRTGKSSIFKHLERKLKDKFVILKLTAGSDFDSEIGFYKSVQSSFVNYLDSLENSSLDDLINIFDDMKIDSFLDFQRFVGKVNRNYCQIENKPLLLMIDEFTRIYLSIKDPNIQLYSNFMDRWKDMIDKNFFKAALIGQDFMPRFKDEYSNQFQVGEPIFVSYLKKEDALDLVTNPIKDMNNQSRFLEDSESCIVDWFCGQPYFIQTYCHTLVQYMNSEMQDYVSIAMAEYVKNELLKETRRDFFDSLLSSYASDSEKKDIDSIENTLKEEKIENEKVLLKIAKNSSSYDYYVPIEDLKLTDKNQYKILENLISRDIVVYNDDSSACKIKMPFFYEWLKIN